MNLSSGKSSGASIPREDRIPGHWQLASLHSWLLWTLTISIPAIPQTEAEANSLTNSWDLMVRDGPGLAITLDILGDRLFLADWDDMEVIDLSSVLDMIETILDEDDITSNQIETWGGV